MAFDRRLILQRAAAARDAAAAAASGDEKKDAAVDPPVKVPRRTTRKDAGFNPRPMDRLVLWAPVSVVGIPVTQATQRVVNFPSGTPCVALSAPRSAWKGKEQLLDVRVETDEGEVEGWIRVAHARAFQKTEEA